jgi:arginine/ornithine N-succinyltransferase beta subunit
VLAAGRAAPVVLVAEGFRDVGGVDCRDAGPAVSFSRAFVLA